MILCPFQFCSPVALDLEYIYFMRHLSLCHLRWVSQAVKVKPSRKPVATRAALVLTPTAVERIKSLLARRPDMSALKIGVKTRGCNGLTYTMDYVNEKGKFDEEVYQDGARLYIDSKAQLTLLGTEVDYSETALASEFIFNNPNVKGFCGCGESFNI